MGIAAEGLPFIGGGLAVSGMSALAGLGIGYHPAYALLPLSLTGFITYFFRDPERVAPEGDKYLYAPADGHVMFVQEIEEDRFIHGPAYRVAIFLSIFNVHINRCPADGTIRYREYVPGNFRAAWQPEVEPGNEKQYLGIETKRGPLVVVQVAGLLARRIVCRPQIGQEISCGERFGLIKFSSRTDLIFPRTMAQPLASPGDAVQGAVTPIGVYL